MIELAILSISKNSNSFTVNNQFVDEFMCDANGHFVKVYLYCLRNAHNENELSISKIASLLNMIQSDVISAFKYWDSVGVLKFEKTDKNDYKVEFFDTFNVKKTDNKFDSGEEITCERKKPDFVHTFYTKSDFTTAMRGNEKIKQLFTLSSQLLNKTLSTNDMNTIYMFYDYLKFSPEVIFSLLEYCVSIGKSNMRYIEKVALSWADAEINTPAKANSFIKSKNKENAMFNKFKSMFKIVGRDFTDSEAELIKTWVNTYKLTDDEILSAYEITVMNTGKIALKYMDSVIKNNINEKSNPNISKVKNNFKKNAFQDYSSDGYEYELEMIKKNISNDN